MRDKPKAKVFVIDDEAIVTDVVRLALTGQYEVLSVSSGTNASDSVRASGCSVVLCDASLPKQGCKNVIAALRHDPETSWIPVIVMSGYLLGAEELGAFAFLQKPFTRNEILTLIRNAIQENPAPFHEPPSRAGQIGRRD